MPRVTIGLPFFNPGRYLEPAIKSILAQTCTDWELILVNDGSTDDSLDVALAIEDRRIRVLSDGVNRGLTARLNQIARQADGEFIARMDADDLMGDERLSHQVAYLDCHPNVSALGTSAYVLDEDACVIGLLEVPSDPTEIRRRLIQHNLMLHSTVMLRRQLLLEVGGYDENLRYVEDYELWFRLLAKSQLANLQEPLAAFRLHQTSSSWRNHRQQILSGLKARLLAISNGLYDWTSYQYLVRPAAALLLPSAVTHGLRRRQCVGKHRL